MMNARSLGYASVLPFAIHSSVRPFRGARGNTKVSLAGRFDSDTVETFVAVLRRFVDLARTGALCGAEIPPWSSGAVLLEPEFRAGMLTAGLQACSLDDAALTVLCDLVVGSGSAAAVECVAVSSDGSADAIPVRQVDRHLYPALYRELPFEYVDEDPEGGGFLVRVEFAGAIGARLESRIRKLAFYWEGALRAGAFSLPPGGPTSNYFEPEELIAFANTMEWPIGKFRADPLAFAAFVNGLAAIGPRSPIVRVELTQ